MFKRLWLRIKGLKRTKDMKKSHIVKFEFGNGENLDNITFNPMTFKHEYNFEQLKDNAEKHLQECYDAPEWETQDNLLAKVEAIRLRAYQEILALGFEDEEIAVDVSLSPEEMTLFKLAKELKWHVSKNGWYEPACETNGGSITIYFEPEETLI